MDRTFQVKESFIKEAHQAACSDWKNKIEKVFPDVFNQVLQVGKWYKSTRNSSLFYVAAINEKSKDCKAFGFNFNGIWVDEKWDFATATNSENYNREATVEVVREALINEAKKRGLVPGIYINSTWCNGRSHNKTPESYAFSFTSGLTMVEVGLSLTIFKDGVWAEPYVEKTAKIIDTPTPEEITRVLDYLKSKQ